MSYREQKIARGRAIVEALHGGTGESVPGLAPIVLDLYPRPSPQPIYDDADEPGWGPSYAVDASLFFPGIVEDN